MDALSDGGMDRRTDCRAELRTDSCSTDLPLRIRKKRKKSLKIYSLYSMEPHFSLNAFQHYRGNKIDVNDKEISLATAYYRDSWPKAEWRRNKKEQKRRNLVGECDEDCDADSFL